MGFIKKSLEGDKEQRSRKQSGRSFEKLATRPISEIAEYQKRAAEGALPGMRMADKQTALALRESGVRGPQAGLERARQSGLRATKLDESISKYSMDDAMRRRDAMLQFYAQKGV